MLCRPNRNSNIYSWNFKCFRVVHNLNISVHFTRDDNDARILARIHSVHGNDDGYIHNDDGGNGSLERF